MAAIKPKRSERKNKGIIPIPSFSCVSPSAAKSSPPSNNKNKRKKSPTIVVRAPEWNESCLTKAEGALHLNRVRRGPANKWSPEGLLRLDHFYVLCRQVALVETPKESVADPDGLTLPERLLCDLVCVSSPVLYQLVQNDDGDWCLEMVEYKGNRLAGLGRLLKRPELDVAKRDATLKAILEHRRLSEKNASLQQETPIVAKEKEQTPLPQSKVIQEPFIRNDMSLEERIRARAQARQEREVDASAKNKSNKPDYSSLLRLADAMWSHSRRNVRRQSQIFSMSNAPFSMTVKDVVRLFAGSLVNSSSLKTFQVHREKATRSEMLQALYDLPRLVPEWISFSSKTLSKDTTVWLSATADIASVRTKLGAPKTNSNSQTKRPLDTTPTPSRVSLSPLAIPTNNRKTTDTSTTSLSSPPKKQRRSPRLAILRKRPAQDSLACSPSKKKKKQSLRINKHFILTDADHNGGMILKPTTENESPRGLKRMFSQLNSGKRI